MPANRTVLSVAQKLLPLPRSALPVGRPRTEAQPMRTIRGAVVGYGFIASRGHLPGYAECARRGTRVEIVAVADACEARRGKASEALPRAAVYGDYERMLDEHAATLDFVDIAVPPARHAEIASAALDRGLHVLCEKPLTTRLADAVALTNKAIVYRRTLFPCHNYRHAPSVRAVRRILDDGVIGSVRCVNQQTFRPTHARGVAEWNPDWRRDPQHAGGGIVMDHGSHTLYLAFEWLGGYPLAVSARTYSLDGLATEDNMNGTFRYAQGIGQATLSWTAGARKVLYAVHGTKGAIIVDDDVVRVSLLDRNAALPEYLANAGGLVTTASHWNDPSHKEWFADMFADFVTAIDEGTFVGKDAQDAVECMNAIEACYASARGAGREIRIERRGELADVAGARLSVSAA
jgi:predicted dehydrogenase